MRNRQDRPSRDGSQRYAPSAAPDRFHSGRVSPTADYAKITYHSDSRENGQDRRRILFPTVKWGGRRPRNRRNPAGLLHYQLMEQRQPRTWKFGHTGSDGCRTKQEPIADSPENDTPQIARDVIPAPPATVNSAVNGFGAPVSSKDCILRSRATHRRDVQPTNMPVAPELTSSPRNALPRKSITPTPPQLSLPEIDRHPSRSGARSKTAALSYILCTPGNCPEFHTDPSAGSCSCVCSSGAQSIPAVPPPCPMAHESKPPPPPVFRGFRASTQRLRPPTPDVHRPTCSAPTGSPYYLKKEPMLTLSQAGRIVDQRMTQHRPIPKGHPAPPYCKDALLPLNHPGPRDLYGRLPFLTKPSPQFAAPSYRSPPVIHPPTLGEILQGDLTNIYHELSLPDNPTFRELLYKTRAFGKHTAFGGWPPRHPPTPLGPAVQSPKSIAQRAKDKQTYRPRVRRAQISPREEEEG